MLHSIKIKKLFNKEDIKIDFNKRSVIITGDNGNGKTTILNVLYNTLIGNYSTVNVKFESVSIDFAPDFEFMDQVKVDKKVIDNGEEISITYNYKNQSLKVILRVLNIPKSIILDKIIKAENSKEDILYEGKNRDEQFINSEKEVSIITLLELIEENDFRSKLTKINESLLYFPTYRRIDLDIESYYASLFDSPIMTLLQREQNEKKKKFGIKDRRVIGMSNSDIEDILKEYTRTLNEVSSKNLDKLLRDFTKNTMLEMNTPVTDIKMSSLDKNLEILEQLEKINSSLNLEIDKDTLQKISSQYEENINFLKKFKNSRISSDKVNQFFEVMLAVPLMQVLQNLQKSYSIYNEQMKNELASYKYISDNLEDFSGRKLKLLKTELNEFKFQKVGTEIEKFSDFSTGEKQLITFLVYSAIKLPDHTPSLIIIDEPELSLHIKWQDKLLKNLLKKNNIQILSATHSPYILNRSVDSSIIRKVEC